MEKILTEVSASRVFSRVNEIPEVFSAKEMEKCWRAWKDEFLSMHLILKVIYCGECISYIHD